MKIDNVDNLIVIYLPRSTIDINNIDEVNTKIKELFIKIMKRGSYNFFGYSKVSIYHNENYGIIMEIEKIFNYENVQRIDLKIIVYKNVTMYIVLDDYYNFNLKDLKMNQGKYYLEINDKLNISKYIEYGMIKYKKIDK